MRPRVEPSELLELGTPTSAILFKLGVWTPDEDRILPRRGYGYFPGMSSEELYDNTRAWWVLSLARAAAYRMARIRTTTTGGQRHSCAHDHQEGRRQADLPEDSSGRPSQTR
jgi:hypothetical protein